MTQRSVFAIKKAIEVSTDLYTMKLINKEEYETVMETHKNDLIKLIEVGE